MQKPLKQMDALACIIYSYENDSVFFLFHIGIATLLESVDYLVFTMPFLLGDFNGGS